MKDREWDIPYRFVDLSHVCGHRAVGDRYAGKFAVKNGIVRVGVDGDETVREKITFHLNFQMPVSRLELECPKNMIVIYPEGKIP